MHITANVNDIPFLWPNALTLSRERRSRIVTNEFEALAPLAGCSGVLAGLLAGSAEPVQRTTLMMGNGKHQNIMLVFLERDEVRKPFDRRLPDDRPCLLGT